MAQYCSNCGPVKAGQKFCINCGSEILLQSRMKETTNKKVIDRISTDGPRNQNSVVNRTRGEELKLKKRKPQR